jgi:fukutin-related protein
MRIRISKCVTFAIVVINLMLFIVSWKYFTVTDNLQTNIIQKASSFKTTGRDKIQNANKLLRRSVTIVFRDFYHYDNDLKNCIDHLLNLIPDIRIIIVCDELPYPPMSIFSSSTNQTSSAALTSLIYKENVQFFHLDMDFSKTTSEKNPLNYIITKYTLFMPDGFRLSNGRQLLQKLIKNLGHSERDKSHRKILAVPFAANNKLFNYWSLQYEVKNTTKNCDMVKRHHLSLIE